MTLLSCCNSRFPGRARHQKAEARFWPQRRGAGGNDFLRPANRNGLHPQTLYLQTHPHQPYLHRLPLGEAKGLHQEQKGTRGRGEGRGGRHSSRGEPGIAGGPNPSLECPDTGGRDGTLSRMMGDWSTNAAQDCWKKIRCTSPHPPTSPSPPLQQYVFP